MSSPSDLGDSDLELRRKYHTGPRFTAAIQSWLEPSRADPMHPTWLDFARSTNLRGEWSAEKLARHRRIAGARGLEVGCAYAGFSLAFARAGGSATGIDVDANLLALAAENVADWGLPVSLEQIDVTDGARMKGLGTFDFVTCSDVIEHVADVQGALGAMAGALDPGGILYLQISNGRATNLVLRDGHYGLFGITLLERPIAERYFAESGHASRYDVEHYLRLSDYREMLSRFGVFPVSDASTTPELFAIKR